MSKTDEPTPKRKLGELSPDVVEEYPVGKMSVKDLMILMSDLMDKKLLNLPTKQDIEEIKTNVNELSDKIETLQSENKVLKDEVKYLREQREKDYQQVIYLQEQSKRNNLIFKNIEHKIRLEDAVKECCTKNLKLSNEIKVISTRKLFERNGKIGVVAEFGSVEMVRDILKHANNLTGSNIILERDLTIEKQTDKRVMLELKRSIQNVSRKHKITVINEKLRINNKWFVWNREKQLVCDKQNGKDVLLNLYEGAIDSIVVNYFEILEKLNSKN